MIHTLPISIVRGGTSRGVFLRLADLPRDPVERDALVLSLVGSPDPLAVDGLGGGASSNSKVMAVGTPADLAGLPWEGHAPADASLITVFAQPAVVTPTVDWAGNCGNLSSAASIYALDAGLIQRDGSRARITVWNANTDSTYLLEHALENGYFPATGEYVMSGAGGPGPRIDVMFLNPGGEKTGSIFPVDRLTEVQGVTVSLVDVANPVVIVAADDMGVDVTRPPVELNQDTALLERIEALRREAGERMGVTGSKAIPRVACVAPGSDGADLTLRVTSMGVFHHASPATVALALGGAAALGGTVLDAVLPPGPLGEITIAHPKGTLTVTSDATSDTLASTGLARTARIIMTGEFRYPTR